MRVFLAAALVVCASLSPVVAQSSPEGEWINSNDPNEKVVVSSTSTEWCMAWYLKVDGFWLYQGAYYNTYCAFADWNNDTGSGIFQNTNGHHGSFQLATGQADIGFGLPCSSGWYDYSPGYMREIHAAMLGHPEGGYFVGFDSPFGPARFVGM